MAPSSSWFKDCIVNGTQEVNKGLLNSMSLKTRLQTMDIKLVDLYEKSCVFHIKGQTRYRDVETSIKCKMGRLSISLINRISTNMLRFKSSRTLKRNTMEDLMDIQANSDEKH